MDVSIRLYVTTRSKYINENTSTFKRVWCGITDYCRFIKDISLIVKKEQYDSVHINTTASLGCIKDILLCYILNKKKIRTYLHYHFGRIPSLYALKNWEWRMIEKSIKLAHKVIVMDHASYLTLKEAGYNNVIELPNPYSPDLEKQIDLIKDRTKRVKGRILFAGRVFKQKGIYELVEACKDMQGIELRLVGPYDESDKKKLLEIIGDNKRIQFVGPVSHEKVIEEMLNCEIFVMPTYTEGFPNAVLECMITKTPIIVTPVGAIPQMLDFDGTPCGISIRPQSVSDITDAINMLLFNSKLQEDISEKAYNRVRSLYSRDSIGYQLYDIWRT